MFKKTMVLFLGLVFVLSLCPVYGVFAASKADGVIVNENFENISSYAMKSQMFDNNSATANLQVVSGGKGGGNAMLFPGTSAYYALGYKLPDDVTSDSFTELSWDMRFQKFPTSVYRGNGTVVTADITFMHFVGSYSGTGAIQFVRRTVDEAVQVWLNVEGTDIVQLTTNDWIHAKLFKLGTGRTYVELYNSNGELLKVTDATSDYTWLFMMGTRYDRYSDAELLIDNIKYSSYSKATYGPSAVKWSMENGAENVATSPNSVTVELDQPLSTLAATLTPTGGSATNCAIALKSGSYRTYEISWSNNLTAGTTYTLDLTGSKNASGVAVDSTGTLTFTTEEPSIEETVIRDSFETASNFTADNPAQYAHYGDSRDTSSFFAHYNKGFCGVTQTQGYTGNGAKVAQFKSNYTSALSTRNAYKPTAAISYVMNFRMKIKDGTVTEKSGAETTYSGGNNISFGVLTSVSDKVDDSAAKRAALIELDIYTGKNYIGSTTPAGNGKGMAGQMGYYYTPDTWYNVTWILTTTYQRFILTDLNGNVCYDLKTEQSYTSSYYFRIAEMYKEYHATQNLGDAAVILDDLALWTVDNTKNSHKLKVVGSITGTEIDKETDKITITYNQPVAALAEMIDIYEGDSCVTPTGKYATATYPDFNQVALDVSNLEFVSQYTLDLGGVTSAGGAAMSDTTLTHSFTTKKDTRYDVSIIGNATLSSETVTAKLHNNTNESISAFLYVAIYNALGELIGIEKSSDIKTLASGMNENVSFALANAYQDAATVKLFVWNGTLQPLGLAK